MAPVLSRGGRRESRTAGWAVLAASLQLLLPWATAASLRYCPPCGESMPLALVQEGNPCGCGGGAVLTPRSELRDMSLGALEERKNQLSAETEQLKGEITTNAAEQLDMLSTMRDRLNHVVGAAAKKKSTKAEGRATMEAEQAKVEAAIEQDDAEAQRLAQEAAKERLTLMQLTHDLSTNLAFAASRCTKCQALMLVEGRLHLVEYGPVVGGVRLGLLSRLHSQGDVDLKEKLVREVEALEEKRAALKEELNKSVLLFSAAQRAMMNTMDGQKRKMGRQDVSDNKATASLTDKAKRLERQAGATARFRANYQQNLDRAKKDVSDLRAKLDELRAAMKQCGCGT